MGSSSIIIIIMVEISNFELNGLIRSDQEICNDPIWDSGSGAIISGRQNWCKPINDRPTYHAIRLDSKLVNLF